jgi:serine O-acetyltransferase
MPQIRAEHPHPLRLLLSDVGASIATDRQRSRPGQLLIALSKALVTTRLQAVILLRLGQAARYLMPPMAAILKYLNTVITGADIALEAQIGPGLRLFHPNGVVVGPNCMLGARCTVMQGVTLGEGVGGSPRLGDDVYIGPGAKIFGDLVVGDRSVVGANAVVLQSVPPESFAAGIPAKVLKRVDLTSHRE